MSRKVSLLIVLYCVLCIIVSVHCKLEYLSNENEPSSENGCVKRVDLSNMGITRLKNNFLKSSTVTRLDLSRNYILKIEDGAFDSLPNLNFVNLTRNLFPFGNLNFTDFSAVETLVLDSSISYIEIKSVYTSFNDFHDDYEVISTRTYHDYEKTIVLLGSMKFFKLKKLYLRKNRIAGINLQDIEALSDVMSSITHLYLNENSLRSVDFLTKFPPTLTHLHLENNQIGSIKTDRSVNSLKVLTVDRNQIESLCGAYQDCYGISMDMFEQLEYFSITYAGLKNISPSSFKYSLALNYLNMSSNAIEIIKDNTFRNLINLETLDLNFNKLQTIPYISDVKNLEYFSIVENGISALDKLNFDGLTNLKILILSHNRLTEIISGTFDELVSLEKLDLSANKLEILSPDWISPKVSLKHLFLNDNSFRSWSSLSLMGIQSLQYVNVTGNPVKLINIRALMTLPENTTVDIGNLNTMNYSEDKCGEAFDFSNMGIMVLKTKFLNSLTLITFMITVWRTSSTTERITLIITIKNSCISAIKLEITKKETEQVIFIYFDASMKFPKFKRLYLRQNRIELLIFHHLDSLSQIMPKLTHLYLGENNLTRINLDSLSPTLTHLYLDDNKISQLTIESSNNSFKVLNINGNQFNKLCGHYPGGGCDGILLEKFPQLEYFSIENVGLRDVSVNAFLYSSALVHLIMSQNNLSQIDNGTFHDLVNLKKLILDDNRLSALPDLSKLKNLELFSIARNEISSLRKFDFDKLENLKSLNLSYNNLGEIIPGTFNGLESLEILDLSGNKLQTLSTFWISPKTKLKCLFLRNNLFLSFSNLPLTAIKNLRKSIAENSLPSIINAKSLMSLSDNVTLDINGDQVFVSRKFFS
ncbi:protein artichoke-like [Cotesia glomerata]|uniref:protein artichoke-like n=1 Tax=Cotesia glomerata TaxID=32391 RepID=UPI001D014A7F|nr:protein artichoke-like [Cotesia glomerata]